MEQLYTILILCLMIFSWCLERGFKIYMNYQANIEVDIDSILEINDLLEDLEIGSPISTDSGSLKTIDDLDS